MTLSKVVLTLCTLIPVAMFAFPAHSTIFINAV
jgi:hypothetical protein